MKKNHITLLVEAKETIASVKKRLEDEWGQAKHTQRLFYQGMLLEDERALSDYFIAEGSMILFLVSLRGGARTKQTPHKGKL